MSLSYLTVLVYMMIIYEMMMLLEIRVAIFIATFYTLLVRVNLFPVIAQEAIYTNNFCL